MQYGVEIDIVVENSLDALKTYKKVFKAEEIEVTDYEKGLNEVIFTIQDTRFHMLDETPEYQLYTPKNDTPTSIWFNIIVEDINKTFHNATEEKFKVIQPITKIEEFGVINTILIDPYGYQWMLHQIIKKVDFEERKKIMEKELNIEKDI
jgi:PhnB protein